MPSANPPSLPARRGAAFLAAAFVSFVVSAPALPAPGPGGRSARAVRVERGAVRLDGSLDEAAWSEAPALTGLTQKSPAEGEPSTRATEVRFVYDDEALYIGARLGTESPGRLRAIVSRRDNAGNSERLIVSLDTYRDRRTAYSFAVTSSGVRIDYYHPADAEFDRDYSFDPVWEARTAARDDGWSAEMRIPFSQLRFADRDEQTWGVNINRWMPDRNEDAYWVSVPKEETGWASRFGELAGIRGIRPPRRFELLPYLAGDARFANDADPGDPFAKESDREGRAGTDFKMGVGPNFTLEGTVNPDFGQVEADPADVNLTAFETYFEERRPFFVEGNRLLRGDGPSYFYSRRIGAPPAGEPDADWVDGPRHTTILGAAKATGRTGSGTSIGVLAALTDEETARTADEGTGERAEVVTAPLAGYGVLRLQREIGEDHSTVGTTFTAVERKIEGDGPVRSELVRRAEAGGVDWRLYFDHKSIVVGGSAGFSRVSGDRGAIAAVQRSSARYYQRPDARHVRLDSSRTALSGHTFSLWASREAGAHWLWEAGASGESPGFEINDAGQLQTADEVAGWGALRYRETKPGRVFREYDFFLGTSHEWNYGGLPTTRSADLSFTGTWKNHWKSWCGVWGAPRNWDDALTRGGPVVRRFQGWNAWVGASNNYASDFQWTFEGSVSGNEIGAFAGEGGTTVSLRTGGRWEFSLRPEYAYAKTARQYVDALDGGPASTFGTRYVFSWLEQSELRTRLRANAALTPDLTLELYAEPFAASGRYFDHGEYRAPRDLYLLTYGEEGGSKIVRNEDGTRTVTVDGATFEIDDDDFNYLSFRLSAVLRWEWRPGSTVFLVWQENRESESENASLVGGRDLRESLRGPGNDTITLKISYWLPLG